MATVAEDPKERIIQEALEAVTWPGETLLGFTMCRLNPGEFLDKIYYVGLTPRRFLLVSKDQPERVYSIYRSYVDRAEYHSTGWLRRSGLDLTLGGERVTLETMQSRDPLAEEMARQHSGWELEAPYLTSTQFLEGIADLVDLGLLRPAQALLRKHMAANPVVEIEPRTDELDRQINEGRWSLRISLGMMIGGLLYSLGRLAFGAAWAGADIPSALLLLLSAVEMVRWKQAWRGLALGFALMAALINLAYSGVGGSLSGGIMWAAFAAAATLNLTGKASRLRNLAAAGVFLLGFLGPLLYGGMATATAPQIRFADDFSSDQGWIARTNGLLTTRIEDGAYAVQVKETNYTFFAFPPLRFNPSRAAFDAQVPFGFMTTAGTYGVTCAYQEGGIGYLVEVDPSGSHFAFLKQDGERFISLKPDYWQKVTGTRIGEGVTKVDVSCANGEINLSLNGVAQGKASAPDLAADGEGKMGLFVRTWPDTGSNGFKVLFDNVSFQQRKTK